MAAGGAGLKRETLGAAGERRAAGAALGGSGTWEARAFAEHVPRMPAGHRGAPAPRLGVASRAGLLGFSRPLPWRGGPPYPRACRGGPGRWRWASV